MADAASITPGRPDEFANAPQLIFNAQYIRDLSFESPRAPQVLIDTREQPEVNLNVDVKARNLGAEAYEVMLMIGAEARVAGQPVFVLELSYGAMVTLRGASEQMVPLMLFIEAPRMMFPFARNIIASMTRDGGFPPLMINPIDFTELLRREQERELLKQQTAAAS